MLKVDGSSVSRCAFFRSMRNRKNNRSHVTQIGAIEGSETGDRTGFALQLHFVLHLHFQMTLCCTYICCRFIDPCTYLARERK